MRRTFSLLTMAAAMAAFSGGTVHAFDTEWEEGNPYYEDDAWYDVTEWLDGNDYNPINEFSGDTDSDWATGYGYDAQDKNNDWFYDYYDDEYITYGDWDNNDYSYSYGYWDTDGDGLYDQSYYLSDPDNDGEYVGIYTSYDVSKKSGNKNKDAKNRSNATARRDQTGQRGEFQQFSGEIQSIKTVNVKKSTHRVARLKTSAGEEKLVDLGRKDALEGDLIKEGKKIDVAGPQVTVGDQKIVMAQMVKIDDQPHKIDRSRGEFTGNISSTKKVTIRGKERLLAMVEKDGKKRAVDLGDADSLSELNLEKGQSVTFAGPPVKIDDRIIIMAHRVEQGGESHEIGRRVMKKDSASSSASDRKRSDKPNKQQQN